MRSAKRVLLPIIAVLLLSLVACRKDTPSKPPEVNNADPVPDPALYQKNDSVRNALLFIGAPEDKMENYIDCATRVRHGMSYELATGKQLDFANRLIALRRTRDADRIIPLLSEGAKASLAGRKPGHEAALTDSNIRHLASNIESGKLFEENPDETRFFATFSRMSPEMLNFLTERCTFSEQPTHSLMYYHYYTPKTMLIGSTFYLIRQDGGYELVDYTVGKTNKPK